MINEMSDPPIKSLNTWLVKWLMDYLIAVYFAIKYCDYFFKNRWLLLENDI